MPLRQVVIGQDEPGRCRPGILSAVILQRPGLLRRDDRGRHGGAVRTVVVGVVIARVTPVIERRPVHPGTQAIATVTAIVTVTGIATVTVTAVAAESQPTQSPAPPE